MTDLKIPRNLIDPSDNGAFAVTFRDLKHTELSDLVSGILGADMLISDFDGTAVKDVAKAEAYSSIKRLAYLCNPRYLWWLPSTFVKLLVYGDVAESSQWQAYIPFLKSEREQERLRIQYVPENVRDKFCPGALEFYKSVPEGMIKIYLTRNIEKIVGAFVKAAGFHKAYCEEFNVRVAVDKILGDYPECRSITFIGDSSHGAETLGILKEKQEEERIKELRSIYVTKSPHQLNPHFDINIGRNYNGLVRLIKEASLPVFQHA